MVSTKLDTFCYLTVANCTVLRAVVWTQYRRVTDGQTDRTDGIAVASKALAMRALRRAVKTRVKIAIAMETLQYLKSLCIADRLVNLRMSTIIRVRSGSLSKI